MEKLKLHTPNLIAENIEKLGALFPDCITEAQDQNGKLTRAIDFDRLRQELSDSLVDGPRERYQLDWPGKREAILAANAPITKTLRPCRDESVSFDTTKNIFIEGDNLDALKLLQETYLNKIKMIYIDPPYNTGTDRIYRDDFSQDMVTHDLNTGHKDDTGNRLMTNPQTYGRFHSAWLTMIYSRLKLARNLLSDDGVLFVSIDDHEVDSAHRVCAEIFGEENFLGRLVWKNATDNNPTTIAVEHEYILVFCKSKADVQPVWKSPLSDIKNLLIAKAQELLQKYPDASSDKQLKAAYAKWFKEHKSQLWPMDGYKLIDKNGIYAGIRGVHNPGKEGYRYDVIHPVTLKPCVQPLMGYRFPKETMAKLLEDDRIIFGDDDTKLIELKNYAQDFQDKLASVIDIDGRSGAYDLRALFPEYRITFENPKPVKLMERLLPFVLTKEKEILLDFFAGSCSSAQALMELNATDGLARRFIMVQIAEPCGEKTDPFKAGVKSVAELGKERVRRAGARINAPEAVPGSASPESDHNTLFGREDVSETRRYPSDTGFRVLKVDASNMKDVYYAPDEVMQADLLGHLDNIREDRTPEDLLFQILVDWGVDLSLPIATESIEGQTVFFVDQNALAACFESDISEELVKIVARRQPLRIVFRDRSYGSDSVKINVEQIFKLLSPSTEVRCL